MVEDIHACGNRFGAFSSALADGLNAMHTKPGFGSQSSLSRFQSSVHSIHFYPYIVVIEKHSLAPARLSALKHGTEW